MRNSDTDKAASDFNLWGDVESDIYFLDIDDGVVVSGEYDIVFDIDFVDHYFIVVDCVVWYSDEFEKYLENVLL